MLAPLQIPLVVFFLLLPLAYGLSGRAREGLRLAWGLGFCLVPCWFLWVITPGLALTTRTSIALGGLIGLPLDRRTGPRFKWRIADVLIVLLCGSMFATLVATKAAGLLGPLPVFLSWMVFYLAGRWFFASVDDIRKFARLMAPLTLMAAAIAFVELNTHKNLWFYLFGRFNVLLEIRGEALRMGLRRACGNTDGPISFGMTMLLTMPWSLQAARDPGGPFWYRWLPAINLGATVCSLSRGPIAFCMLAWGASIFFARPRLRRPLGALAVLGGAFVLFALDPILEASAEFIGDKKWGKVTINGRVEAINSTAQRKLMREAYEPVLVDAGYFGFGPDEIATIPVRYNINRSLASIESHYILHQVIYGRVGIILFNLLAGAVVLGLARLAWSPRGPLEDLAGSLAGAQAAVLMGVLSVFFSYEHLNLWLFHAGLAGNLLDLGRQQKRAASAAASAAAIAARSL